MEAFIDERFSDETKEFIKGFIPKFSPMYTLDMAGMRKFLDDTAQVDNEKIKFDQIKLQELTVKNLNDGYEIPVTAYIPNDVKPTSPFVVFFHGGGWRLMSRKTHHMAVAHLATQSKTIWLSVEYRLSPEYKHPIGVEDCYSVTKWVLENKTKAFSSDKSSKVGVSGDSCGGHLAAWVAHRLRKELAFQILVYPMLDLTYTAESRTRLNHARYMLTKEVFDSVLKDFLNNQEEAALIEASPLFDKDLKNLPKCLIINAEFDPLIDDGFNYKKKLDEANVECERHIINGVIHGFFHAYFDYKNAYLESATYILEFLKKF